MGWLNTVLNVASLGVEIAQLGKLEDMRQQGAATGAMQAILQEIRNQIFKYKQAAQEILESKASTPKVTAGAMRILEMRLYASGITPELFPEIADKEYVSGTHKFIREASVRLREVLPPSEIDEIESMARTAMRLPEYGYYIERYEDFAKYKEAKEINERTKMFSGFFAQQGIGCVVALVAIGFVGMFAALFGDNFMTGMIIGTIIVAIPVLWYRRQMDKMIRARKMVKELDQVLDLDLLYQLDNECNGDKFVAVRTKQAAEAQISAFFKDSPLLPI